MKTIIIFIFLNLNTYTQSILAEHYNLLHSSFQVQGIDTQYKGIGFYKKIPLNQSLQGNLYLKSNQFSENKDFRNRFLNFIGFGLGYQFFQINLGIAKKEEFTNPEFNLEFKINKNHSILFNYKESLQNASHSYSLSSINGNDIKLGLCVSYNYSKTETEWTGYFTLSFQWNPILVGGISKLKSKSENEFLINYKLSENRGDSIPDEENNIYQEKIKDTPLKKKSKEFIIHELSLQELLNQKIPLEISLRIQKASKDKKEYVKLLNSLPKEIQSKCNSLQMRKNKEKE